MMCSECRDLLSGHIDDELMAAESQAVRDVVVIGVAQRIVAGDVPDALAGKRLFKLNLEKLFHDSSNAKNLKFTCPQCFRTSLSPKPKSFS